MIGISRICELDGCTKSLANMNVDARFCCPAHRAKAHRLALAAEVARLRAALAEAGRK